MTAGKILIVEDEAPIREMIAFHLVRAGYETLEACDCRSARQLLADERPDLALIDWMLPDMSGLELTRTLKRDKGNEDLGIIMLTARADEYDKVAGLEGGADDYVTKPFAPRELIARIQAVLRRARSSNDEIIEADMLELDTAGHRVTAGGDEIRLGPHRIPTVALPDDTSRSCIQSLTAARPGLGRQRLCGGAHGRRARTPLA